MNGHYEHETYFIDYIYSNEQTLPFGKLGESQYFE